MRKTLIVAMARNRVIGRNNKLPWYLPEDLRYFKEVTMHKPIIMGRRTFESIGRPLPGRLNIVVTSDTNWSCPAGAARAGNLDEAFRRAQAQAELDGVDEMVVIGGGQLYKEALPLMDRLYITQVHADVEGDVYFPEVDWDEWEEVAAQEQGASEQNPYSYSFVVYDRRRSH